MPIKGYSLLDVSEVEGLGLSNPPIVEQSVAHHLHPKRRTTLISDSPSHTGKMESFTTSTYQKISKSSALAVQALNVTSLLIAYQGELLVKLGTQLDASNPNPVVWKSLQSCGHTMALAIDGKRSLWLLSIGAGRN